LIKDPSDKYQKFRGQIENGHISECFVNPLFIFFLIQGDLSDGKSGVIMDHDPSRKVPHFWRHEHTTFSGFIKARERPHIKKKKKKKKGTGTDGLKTHTERKTDEKNRNNEGAENEQKRKKARKQKTRRKRRTTQNHRPPKRIGITIVFVHSSLKNHKQTEDERTGEEERT